LLLGFFFGNTKLNRLTRTFYCDSNFCFFAVVETMILGGGFTWKLAHTADCLSMYAKTRASRFLAVASNIYQFYYLSIRVNTRMHMNIGRENSHGYIIRTVWNIKNNSFSTFFILWTIHICFFGAFCMIFTHNVWI
jgi:hypothetical protein